MLIENKNEEALGITKPKLVIAASQRSRNDPSSPLLRFVRDYSQTLKQFEIHATKMTGQAILGTGLYEKNEIVLHRAGADGGVAELAAIAARGECLIAILISDPSDPWSDTVLNRALKRVCIQKQIRLITTYAAAVRWATYESSQDSITSVNPFSVSYSWGQINFNLGNKNVDSRGDFKLLPINQRTLALIAHDKKKLEMVQFVKEHVNLISQHHRILTTGTTGWLLKLLFANNLQQASFIDELKSANKLERLVYICEEALKDLNILPARWLDANLESLRASLKVPTNEQLAAMIMPLPSGPEGGDVLIADEVLKNECHTIIFFHDPLTAHPHNSDIRLLEHTCQLPGVFAECVSDRQSAERWVKGLITEMSSKLDLPDLAHKLRQKYKLKEVVVVNTNDDSDSEKLGQMLARALAGHLNQRLHCISQENKQTRIGVAWGWTMRRVLEELVEMQNSGLIEKPVSLSKLIIWSPLIGIITAEITDWEASTIAQRFCDFYGGRVRKLPCAGFARVGAEKPKDVEDFITSLEEAEIILTSASAWNEKTALYKYTGLNTEYFPKPSEVVGNISGIFINHDGDEVRGLYSIVGLGYDGFRRAAKKGAVWLMCGGEDRRAVLLAALKKELVSVLITTNKTAEWILQQDVISTLKV